MVRRIASVAPVLAAAATLLLASPAAALCGDRWVIAPGDTMNKIAARCGIPVESIKAANPAVDPFAMRVGAVLTLDPEAVLPGLPGNRPPDPDGSGPFLSWLELEPGEADPTLPDGAFSAGAVGAGTITTSTLEAAGIGTRSTSTATIGLGGLGGGADAADALVADVLAGAPSSVGSGVGPDAALPGTDAGAGPGADAAVETASAGAEVLNPYDPALAAQAAPFPITTQLGTPPSRPAPAGTSQQRPRPTITRAPSRSAPVIRLSGAQARAALAAIRAGRTSGRIGGLDLSDPAARRALRRALGR